MIELIAVLIKINEMNDAFAKMQSVEEIIKSS